MCYSALLKMDEDYLHKRYGAIASSHSFVAYTDRSDIDPKSFPKLRERIYPGHYAPVMSLQNAKTALTIMRYGAYPPPHIEGKIAKNLTTYNARRDNLISSFWSEAFTKHHGFVVIKSFYEWVSVRALVKAGVVSIDQVNEAFTKQANARKLKILSAGKKYKPTPTELKHPLERQIIIAFTPEDEQDLLAPVIYSSGVAADEKSDLGFAIVTDDPPFEVRNAGHDRCPVILTPEAIEPWLKPDSATPQQLLKLLIDKKRKLTFKHALAENV